MVRKNNKPDKIIFYDFKLLTGIPGLPGDKG
jgi:hypothetical protein